MYSEFFQVCTLKLIDFGKAIRIKDQNGNQLPGHQDGIDYSRCSQHSVNVILGIAPTQNDDWSSLVYLLMKMRGFSWGDTAEEMLDLKVQFVGFLSFGFKKKCFFFRRMIQRI